VSFYGPQNHIQLPYGSVHTFFRQNREAVAAYTAVAVNFDGTNDYLTRGADLTGNADGKQGIVSLWVNFAAAGNGAVQELFCSRDATNIGIQVVRLTDNTFRLLGRTTAGTTILTIISNSTYTSASGWVHLLLSWNLAATAGWLYVDDANDQAAGATLTDGTIEYTKTDHVVGATHVGAGKLNGDMAELYVNYATHLDLSVEANRRKFISATGKPVNLGSNGSTPTGSQPLIYLANPLASWETNLGTGGGFTENGALTAAASSPSD
jgi:hypothetical protein